MADRRLGRYEIVRNGVPYDLSTGGVAFDVALDGIGIPPVSRTIITAPQKDGNVDDGYSVGSREMQLHLFFNMDTEANADARRDVLYNIFRPGDDPLTLIYYRADGAERHIACNLNGEVSMAETDRTGVTDQNFVVPLLATDPIWHDNVEQSWLPDIATSGQNNALAYAGNWHSYPVIYLTGEMVSPRLEVETSHYGGTTADIWIQDTIPSGVTWILDLSEGRKTLRDGTTNKFASINTSFTDVSLYRIDVDVVQNFQLYYTSIDGSAELEYRYYNRFIGA